MSEYDLDISDTSLRQVGKARKAKRVARRCSGQGPVDPFYPRVSERLERGASPFSREAMGPKYRMHALAGLLLSCPVTSELIRGNAVLYDAASDILHMHLDISERGD
ncbi:hypothetical protein EN829_022690 [Mesorhizobium sp. M00.F.Ca.ET.186.01.1.1]|nr:hypothetical protein EN829_022690 [Mesorhizobium sp. M00.F.Ca.ET.186.01.1.1]